MGKVEKVLIAGLILSLCAVINSAIYQFKTSWQVDKVEDNKQSNSLNMYYEKRVSEGKPYFNEYGYVSYEYSIPALR